VGTELDVNAILQQRGIDYVTVPRQLAPRRTALAAKRGRRPPISPKIIAQTVLLADSQGQAIAVIPADRSVDLAALKEEFGRSFRLVGPEAATARPPGAARAGASSTALRPLAETYVEQSLILLPEVYMKTSDAGRLVRVDGESFRSLFYGAWCGHISQPNR